MENNKGKIAQLKQAVEEIRLIREKWQQREKEIKENDKEIEIYFSKLQTLRTVSNDKRYKEKLQKLTDKNIEKIEEQEKYEEEISKLQDYIIKMAEERITYWNEVKDQAEKGNF